LISFLQNISNLIKLKVNFVFRLKGQEGFSLLEALIAVLLVGLGLLAYGVSSGVTVATNAKSEKKSIGITLAQDKMENIKDIGGSTSLTGADSLANPTYSGGVWSAGSAEDLDSEGNTGGSGTYYQRTWTIDQATAAFLYDATVTVTWGTHSRDTVTLQTRIAR
jgi:Tfp pilus assembly protein PilV